MKASLLSKVMAKEDAESSSSSPERREGNGEAASEDQGAPRDQEEASHNSGDLTAQAVGQNESLDDGKALRDEEDKSRSVCSEG